MLSSAELREILEAVVLPTGHPDPMGFIARMVLFSEADPDYVDVDGKFGILPMTPDFASQLVGATEIQSLQGNIVAALAIDMLNFSVMNTLEEVIIAFHESGADTAGPITREALKELPQARVNMRELLYPRKATVKDVIKLLSPENTIDVTPEELDFFNILRAKV